MATGAIIAGGAALSAGADIYGSIQAGKQADAAQAQQFNYLNRNLDFQQQQFQHWEDLYGPIQQNLSNFYQQLTPETFAASGLKQFDQQFQAYSQNLQRSFAQRGIDSPAQDFLNQNAAINAAEAKAGIRQRAPLQVADAKQSFVSHAVANPNAAGVSNALSNFTNAYGDQATQARHDQAAGIQAAGQAIQGGITAFTSLPSATPKPAK